MTAGTALEGDWTKVSPTLDEELLDTGALRSLAKSADHLGPGARMRPRSRRLAAAQVDRQRRLELSFRLDREQRVPCVREVEMPHVLAAPEPLRAVDEHSAHAPRRPHLVVAA